MKSETLTEMDFSYHVARLLKPGDKVLQDLTPEKANLVHLALGISGEAGELLDAIKKHTMYNKPLDIENVKEELGDLFFYLTGLMDALFLDQREVLLANVRKLSARYPENRYSNEAAIARRDKEN